MRAILSAITAAAALLAAAAANAATVTLASVVSDLGGGPAGELRFSFDDAAPLVTTGAGGSLPAGTSVFAVSSATLALNLDFDDPAEVLGDGRTVTVAGAFPSLVGVTRVDEGDILAGGLGFLPAAAGGAFIEAPPPADAVAFGNLALFTWSFSGPLSGLELIVSGRDLLARGLIPEPSGIGATFEAVRVATLGDPAPPVAPIPVPASGLLMIGAAALLAGLRARPAARRPSGRSGAR